MSDTVLGGNWTVFYLAENRQKRIVWTGSATGTNTVNQLYSALADLFDDLNQMDDGAVMSAQTPTQYTIGLIDPSDKDAWYVDRTSVEHLTGGALTTNGWARVTGTTTGIVRVPYTIGTDFLTTDIGKTVTNGTSLSTGTLLDFNTTGATKYMWIRPASNASANDWAGSSGTVTVTGGSAASVTQSAAAATGEGLWSNLFSLGTIVSPGTHLYLYQGGSRVLAYKNTAADWWPDGQIDMLLPTKELGTFLDGLPTPTNAAFSTATTGGTLAAGTYWYRVTALNAQGETLASTETSQVTTGSASTVTVNWNSVAGATGYKVYGRSTGAELYMQQLGSGVTTWIDTGSVTPSGAFPTANTTGSYVTVFARQYDQTYSDFTVNVSAGGRNPIPLATGSDLNNTTGYREFAGSAGVGTFQVGEVIYAPGGGALSAATKAAIVTKVAGTVAAPVLDYYIIMAASTGLLTDFVNTDAVKGNTSGATATAAAPSNVGPSTSGVTVTYGANNTFDIPQTGTNQGYSIVIDLLNTQSVAAAYEFSKYITRFGAGTTMPPTAAGAGAEQYIGSDYRILYSTITGTINVGDVVTQLVSRAVGTVVANNTAPASGSKYLILRNSTGTFDSTNPVQKDSSNFVSSPTSTAITPIHAAPFGTFAGGTWFCAPGVVLKNFLNADTNNFQLVDDLGTVRKEPTSVTITVSNTRQAGTGSVTGDGVSVFRLTAAGGIVNKTQFTATVQSAGATTAVVSATIPQDVPGRSTGGVVRLVSASTSPFEFRMRYSSYAASTFTLASLTAQSATSGTTSTTIFATGSNFTTAGILAGDIVRNTTHAAIGYVVQVVSATELTVTSMPGFVSGDNFEINTLPVATTASDNFYVPFIDVIETSGTDATPGSQSKSNVFLANIPVVVRVRHNTSGDQYNILPFETTGTITSAGLSVSAIRTKDSIST